MGPLKRDEKREGRRDGLKDECIRSVPLALQPSFSQIRNGVMGRAAMQRCQEHQKRKLVVLHIDLDVACLYHSPPSSMSSSSPPLLYTLPLLSLRVPRQIPSFPTRLVPPLSLSLARSAIEGTSPASSACRTRSELRSALCGDVSAPFRTTLIY